MGDYWSERHTGSGMHKATSEESLPRLCVVIPTYNSSGEPGDLTIGPTFFHTASHLVHYPGRVDFVIVDDGSNLDPDTAKVLEVTSHMLGVHDCPSEINGRVHHLPKNGGKAAALAYALEHRPPEAELILFLDDDTVPTLDFIVDAATRLAPSNWNDRRPLGAVTASLSPKGPVLSRAPQLFGEFLVARNDGLKAMSQFGALVPLPGACTMFTRECLERVGAADVLRRVGRRSAEDVSLGMEVARSHSTALSPEHAFTQPPGSLEELYRQQRRWTADIVKNRVSISRSLDRVSQAAHDEFSAYLLALMTSKMGKSITADFEPEFDARNGTKMPTSPTDYETILEEDAVHLLAGRDLVSGFLGFLRTPEGQSLGLEPLGPLD